MAAIDKGVRIGGEYLRRIDPKQTTLSQFAAMARTCAKHLYKTDEKQREFVKGWFAYTQRFHHLFKDWPTQRRIRGVILECAHCGSVVEVEYDTAVSLSAISEELKVPCPVCMDGEKV